MKGRCRVSLLSVMFCVGLTVAIISLERQTVLLTSIYSFETIRNGVAPDEQAQLYFVMHVGPPKTGTSTIQCALRSIEDNALAADKYTLMETQSCRPGDKRSTNGPVTYDSIVGGTSWMPGCLMQWNRSGMPSCWHESYGKFIAEQKYNRHSIVVSNENLAEVSKKFANEKNFTNDLVNALDGFNVVVVATYRHWFDWIVSAHAQKFGKGRKFKSNLNQWPDHGGGRPIPTLEHFVSRVLRNKRLTFPFTDVAVDAFREHPRIHLKIMSMHDGDLLSSFFCDCMERAPQACASSANKITENRSLSVSDLWIDAITVEAHKRGLVPSKASRLSVLDRAKKFYITDLAGENATDFPMVCPPQTFFEQVLQESLRLENRTMPKGAHTTFGKRHSVSFAEAVRKKKFCAINATAALEDKRWLSFFGELK